MTTATDLDRDRLAAVHRRELERFAREHPRSRELFQRARGSLVSGVPMTWMAKWVGGHPVYAARAHGATVEDVDGHRYVDFALGDTGAMAGHSPPATVAAVQRRLAQDGGATLMLPTEDAAWVGEELGRRFGVSRWSFALSATDANRWALRLCRAITARPQVLVFNYCYHGSVDETFVTLDAGGGARSREGNVGPAVDPATTTRVCEFNDLDALERALADRQVACVLAEPALTNIGIVLPEAGFHAALRELCDATGTLLIADETHTFSAGPGGCTAAWELRPDLVTIGKAIAGGIPIGAYGVTAEVGERIAALDDADLVDVGGVAPRRAGRAPDSTTGRSRTCCISSCSTAASSSRRSTTWRSCRRRRRRPTSTGTPRSSRRPCRPSSADHLRCPCTDNLDGAHRIGGAVRGSRSSMPRQLSLAVACVLATFALL